MKRSSLDIIYGVGAAVIAGYFLWSIAGAVPPETSIANDPYWYPRILLILILLLALVMIVRGVVAGSGEMVSAPRWVPLASAVLIVGGYTLLFTWTGFVISTLLFFPVFAFAVGYRQFVAIAIATPLVTAFTWYAFHYGLGMTPPGPGLPLLP